MNLILRYLEGRKSAPATNPKLTRELKDTQKQLNSILTKWKFGDTPLTSAQEFLANFEPWINRQLEQQKEWKVFLAKKGVRSLAELASLPTDESEQLKFFKDNLKVKESLIEDYKNQEQTWTTTEADYLRRIEELQNQATSEEETLKQELAKKEQEIQAKVQEFRTSNRTLLERIEELQKAPSELPEDYEDLITERDEAIREKRTLEQEVLATNNRLNLKNQEVSNKEKALQKLKREKNQLELTQQKVLKEKNSLITTLNLEVKQLEKEINQLKGGQT